MQSTERPSLRHAVRGLILDQADRVLLCRHDLPHTVVWAAPGGGVEPGETTIETLRRELREEVGLVLDGEPPRIWHQKAIGPAYAPGFDGVVNDYFLLRVRAFDPRGSFSDAELAAENIREFRWWGLQDILASDAAFSPRALGRLLPPILARGAPDEPIPLGV